MKAAVRRPRSEAPRRNAAQLRSDINHGRTGDKIAWPDPAMAPLGTDDEAGATPPDRRDVQEAAASELAGPNTASQNAGGPARLGAAVWFYTLVILGLALLFGWGALNSG